MFFCFPKQCPKVDQPTHRPVLSSSLSLWSPCSENRNPMSSSSKSKATNHWGNIIKYKKKDTYISNTTYFIIFLKNSWNFKRFIFFLSFSSPLKYTKLNSLPPTQNKKHKAAAASRRPVLHTSCLVVSLDTLIPWPRRTLVFGAHVEVGQKEKG